MKNISKAKADYYINRLSLNEYESVRNKNITRAILMYPLSVWRIPVAVFYLFYKLFELALAPSDEFDFNIVFGFIIMLGCVGSFFASPYISVIAIIFFYTMDYCFRIRNKMRNDYRLAYNRKHGYAYDYDEYDIKYDKYDYDESYTYYYKDTGAGSGYGYNQSSGQNNNYYRQSGPNNGTGTQTQDNKEENIFAGLSPDEAKDKYRDLLKMYHPDNLETGDAEKAKEIIAQYEELYP